MPIKPLPPSLIARLRRLGQTKKRKHPLGNNPLSILFRALGGMKNIDPRKRQGLEDARVLSSTDTNWWGLRVRELDVSRHLRYPAVVLKRVHYYSRAVAAKDIVDAVKAKVAAINKRKPKTFILECLPAEAVSYDIVAMPKVAGIALTDVLRGRAGQLPEFLDALRRKKGLKKSANQLEAELRTAIDQFVLRNWQVESVGSLQGTLEPMVYDYRRGKFVFTALPELHYEAKTATV